MESYAVGAKIRMFGTITDSSTGDLFDPTTVICVVKPPHDEATSPVVTKDSTGEYHADVVVSVPGIWTFRFEGTGSDPSANESAFFVRPTEV